MKTLHFKIMWIKQIMLELRMFIKSNYPITKEIGRGIIVEFSWHFSRQVSLFSDASRLS